MKRYPRISMWAEDGSPGVPGEPEVAEDMVVDLDSDECVETYIQRRRMEFFEEWFLYAAQYE